MDEPQRPAQDDPADVLANMADGIHDEPDESAESAPEDAPATPHDDAPALSEGPFEEDASVSGSPSPSPRRRRTGGPRKPAQPTGFHFVAAQLSIAMGILLMAPVVWSVLVLSGVLAKQAEGDTTKWLIMLILAAPLGGLLLFGGIWYNNHLKQYRQTDEPDETENEA